jgi:hypothetical protein
VVVSHSYVSPPFAGHRIKPPGPNIFDMRFFNRQALLVAALALVYSTSAQQLRGAQRKVRTAPLALM